MEQYRLVRVWGFEEKGIGQAVTVEVRLPSGNVITGQGAKNDPFQAVIEAIDFVMAEEKDWVVRDPKIQEGELGNRRFEAKITLISDRISPPESYDSATAADQLRAMALAYLNAINQLLEREERVKENLHGLETAAVGS